MHQAMTFGALLFLFGQLVEDPNHWQAREIELPLTPLFFPAIGDHLVLRLVPGIGIVACEQLGFIKEIPLDLVGPLLGGPKGVVDQQAPWRLLIHHPT